MTLLFGSVAIVAPLMTIAFAEVSFRLLEVPVLGHRAAAVGRRGLAPGRRRHADPADDRRVTPPRVLVQPVPALTDIRVRLFLTSAALLFVELFLIRWIPANVIYVGFFANIILIGSFLGIGVGIILGRRASAPLLAPFPLLFFLVDQARDRRPAQRHDGLTRRHHHRRERRVHRHPGERPGPGRRSSA